MAQSWTLESRLEARASSSYRGQLCPHIAIPALSNTFWSASEAYRFRLIGYGSPHRGMSERLFPTGARARPSFKLGGLARAFLADAS